MGRVPGIAIGFLTIGIATLQHEDEIRARVRELRAWTGDLAAQLRRLGARTYPICTYFFLADFSPIRAAAVAEHVRFVAALEEVLRRR
jgi:histidinol-phosphate/aromatic aminotransferase/cobyric acid decarboxylase-like protein